MRQDRIIKLPVFRTMFLPVARKAWKCDLCRKAVEEGRRYVHYIDRRPHEIISYRFHTECFAMVEAYCTVRKKTTFTPRSVQYWAKKAYCASCPNDCRLYPCDKIQASVNTLVKKKKRQSKKNDIPY